MARPKLVTPDQPLGIRIILRIYELAASLQLAVLLLFGMAGTLALATAVEATFSTAVVQFSIYKSWWFSLLYGLLALNIFCAATIRYPWKKHQTGFVITHIGLLVLLFSGALSRKDGIDSQVHVWENNSSGIAFDDSYFFRVVSTPKAVSDPHAAAPQGPLQAKIQSIPFKPGVFSWANYSEWFANLEVAKPGIAKAFSPLFYLAKRNQPGDVLYNQDGVQLEVLDYYGDSDWKENTPTVELRISMPAMKEQDSQGRTIDGKVRWIPLELSVQRLKESSNYRYGFGDRQRMGGGSFTFAMVGTRAATEAFLDSAPEGEVGPKGQLILHAGGKKTVIDVEAALDKEPASLEGTNLKYKVAEHLKNAQASRGADGSLTWTDAKEEAGSKNPGVRVVLLDGEKEVDELLLLSDMPDVNLQAYDAQVFGDYWFDHGEKSSSELLQGGGGSRIDIIQGVADGTPAGEEDLVQNKRLFYRYWNRKEIVAASALEINGKPDEAVDAFTMPIGTLKMYVKNFIPSDRPKGQPIRIPFTTGKTFVQPAVKVRVSAGQEEIEDFWLWAHINEPDSGYFEGITQKTIDLGDREVSFAMPVKSTEIGFRIYLDKFERKLDPGTAQASHYSSDVRYLNEARDRVISYTSTDSTINSFIVEGMENPRAPVVSGDQIFWIDNGRRSDRSIFVASLKDGNGGSPAKEIVSFGAFDPQSLVIDTSSMKIYWTDRQFGRSSDLGLIREANLDGSGVRSVTTYNGSPNKLALDSTGGYLFFTDDSSGNIGRVKTDGSDLNPNWLESSGWASGVAVDVKKQLVYWADKERNAIRVADYEAKSLDAVYLGSPGKGEPNSLALDAKNQILYWTDIAPNGVDPNAAKYRNDSSLDRAKPREVLTRVRSLKIGEKDPSDLPIDQLDQPGEAFCDNTTGQVFWSQTDLLKSDVWITMNAPDEFSDPVHYRNLRIFQESFDGPYKPGTREYQQNVPAISNVPEVYRSVFSVNYDPGTPLRYWGCFLVCIGIACMFYMRAYFFTGKKKAEPTS